MLSGSTISWQFVLFLVLLQCYPDNNCTSNHNMLVIDNMW